jgi:hypothetical protein
MSNESKALECVSSVAEKYSCFVTQLAKLSRAENVVVLSCE